LGATRYPTGSNLFSQKVLWYIYIKENLSLLSSLFHQDFPGCYEPRSCKFYVCAGVSLWCWFEDEAAPFINQVVAWKEPDIASPKKKQRRLRQERINIFLFLYLVARLCWRRLQDWEPHVIQRRFLSYYIIFNIIAYLFLYLNFFLFYLVLMWWY
jgi:hypothetical protein